MFHATTGPLFHYYSPLFREFLKRKREKLLHDRKLKMTDKQNVILKIAKAIKPIHYAKDNE